MTTGYRMIVQTPGGVEALIYESFDVPEPGPGELLIETEAIGLNFIDTYFREGLYPNPMPLTLGQESVGTIVAVGDGVEGFAVGDRVGSVLGLGAYATHRVIAAGKAVHIPAGIASDVAAAAMLKGFTACYLAEDTYPTRAGTVALVHSAAGGVGSFLVPWLTARGVTVIAHSGTPRKASTVDTRHSLSCSLDELPDAVRRITGGTLCDVVYDGVGKDSWNTSIACVRPRGMMVSYGNASGAVPPISLLDLMRGGSLYVTRPTLGDYVASPEMLASVAERLFSRIVNGVVTPVIGQRFALADAADAHRALESRQTTGSTVLIP